jgi:hypothetical protein
MVTMNRPAISLAVLACLSVHAQGNADLMKTPECALARTQFEQVLAAGGPRERLNAVRELTALKCFGVKPSAPPEGRFVPPPVAVDAIRLRPELFLSAPVPALPQAAAPTPPPAIPRPPVLTACDASGCWDSNGTRYNQQGPVLLGPKGVCTLQAGALNCP